MMQMSTGPLSHPRFALITERIGSLPLINHFLERMDLLALLEQGSTTRPSSVWWINRTLLHNERKRLQRQFGCSHWFIFQMSVCHFHMPSSSFQWTTYLTVSI